MTYRPTRAEMEQLATEGNLMPVWRELPADLETPVSVYLKVRGAGPSFLLESVERGEHVGRYSFLGVEPAGVLTVQHDQVWWQEDGLRQQLLRPTPDPLAALREILSRYRPTVVEGLPHFYGGLVGYLAYEVTRFFERIPQPPQARIDLPEAVFLLTDTLIIFDHVKRRLLVTANAHVGEEGATTAYQEAVGKIEAIVSRLQESPQGKAPRPPAVDRPATEPRDEGAYHANVDRRDFEAAVGRAKAYITAGDIFQVVLSQRLSRRTTAEPFAIYRTLRMLNPSPYMFYLDLPGDLYLIGSSPETMVRLEGRQAEVRPIAGTRPRGGDQAEDEILAQELLDDPKERAEHVMLVDLGRNDLGRVCRYGSVQVPQMMAVERYSHVMHIVSKVQGELRPEMDAFDLLRATFPAGTVSGAPKVRAMEIIAELERERRGPYAGAVGYFGYGGDMDTCIAIRTVVMQHETAHIQAGAGIVSDSDPAREYQETLGKAQALVEAVNVAERGPGGRNS